MAPKVSRSWWTSGLVFIAVIGATATVVTVAVLRHRGGAD
jgi:hypothetical protein